MVSLVLTNNEDPDNPQSKAAKLMIDGVQKSIINPGQCYGFDVAPTSFATITILPRQDTE